MKKLLLLTALAACTSAPEDIAPLDMPAPVLAARAPEAKLGVEADGRAEGFTLSTRRIEATLAWPVSDGRRVVFEIYAPGGVAYRRDVREISAGTAAIALPVAGTNVSDFALAGDWEVRVYAEGDSLPLASAEFTVAAL